MSFLLSGKYAFSKRRLVVRLEAISLTDLNKQVQRLGWRRKQSVSIKILDDLASSINTRSFQ